MELTYEIISNDYAIADSMPSLLVKKELSAKYNVNSNKVNDIKIAIVKAMRDYRKAQTVFNDCDLKWFYRLDIPETYNKLVPFMDAESKAFLKFWSETLEKYIVERNLTNKLWAATKRDFNYYMSYSDRMYCLRYINVMKYLDQDTKKQTYTPEAKIKSIMLVQMKSFHDEYIERVKKHAESYWNMLPELINKSMESMNAAKKIYYAASTKQCNLFNTGHREEANEVYKNEYMPAKQDYEKKTRVYTGYANVVKKYKDLATYLAKCVEDAETKYNNNVDAIVDRIKNKEFIVDSIKITNVMNDPKFYEMTITDGVKKVHCRSIWAAEMSTKMTPHFRFIVTNQK